MRFCNLAEVTAKYHGWKIPMWPGWNFWSNDSRLPFCKVPGSLGRGRKGQVAIHYLHFPSLQPQISYCQVSTVLQDLTSEQQFFFFFFLVFSGLHQRHMEIPRLGVESELCPLAYATATATPDPRHLCDLHHTSPQCWILKQVSGARDRTCVLMDTSQIPFL